MHRTCAALVPPGARLLPLVAALATLTACTTSAGGTSSDAGCEDMALHFERICGEGFGSIQAASLRYDCETFGYPEATVRCVLAQDSCDPDKLDACDIHDRHWICAAGNSECPPGLECNAELEECTACDSDEACDPGQLCLGNWCVTDTETNRMLQGLL